MSEGVALVLELEKRQWEVSKSEKNSSYFCNEFSISVTQIELIFICYSFYCDRDIF